MLGTVLGASNTNLNLKNLGVKNLKKKPYFPIMYISRKKSSFSLRFIGSKRKLEVIIL